VRAHTPDEVRALVAASRTAQAGWARTTFRQRRRVLRRILDHVVRHADELVDVMARDSGKTRQHALLGEIWTVAEKLRWTIAHGEPHLRPERVGTGLLVHKRARVEYVPRGVVGVIAPFNYPLQNVLGPTIPALFAGNGVVCKVSEQVAWSGDRIQRILDEALAAEDVDPRLVRLVHGDGDVGRALIQGGIDQVVFTGSVGHGRKVMAAAAEHLVPCILELGGKDPAIVCDDADVERAVFTAMAGAFVNAGQSCLAIERVLLLPGVADAFEARIEEEVARLRCGDPVGPDPVDVGSLVSARQCDVVEELVQDAIASGARRVVGGHRIPGPGHRYAPTVLADVTPAMRIAREETFGPVVVLMRVADEAEAVAVANGTPFGLSSSVFTRDRARFERIAAQLHAGSSLQNDFGLAYMAQDLPFGGVKDSGFGRLNGRDGLRAMCHPKAVMTDRFPTPPAKLFPATRGTYARSLGTIEALYGPGVLRRLRGVVRAVIGR
jgi:acyl-CoA reductase-like NAD-dependent aldehyde dehydrogenase